MHFRTQVNIKIAHSKNAFQNIAAHQNYSFKKYIKKLLSLKYFYNNLGIRAVIIYVPLCLKCAKRLIKYLSS